MIKFDESTIKEIDLNENDQISILITKKNNITEHRTFTFTRDYRIHNINVITKSTLNDLFWYDDFNSIVDVKCPQSILDRSIKFCKKHKAEFLFALGGVYGVTIYVKKNKKSGEFCRTKLFLRYNKYFCKKYRITWNVIEV